LSSLQVRKRHRLRQKETQKLSERLYKVFGADTFSLSDTVDSAETKNYDILYVNNEVLAMILNDEPFLTIKGILKYHPRNRWVTVDMGAVKFVYNGADVMAPGIVNADLTIERADLVWVRDEKNLQPLAIGKALMSGIEMISANNGKAIETLHYVGDKLWEL
jgi:PUA domain protein